MSQNLALNELWFNTHDKGLGGANSPEPLLLAFKSMEVYKDTNQNLYLYSDGRLKEVFCTCVISIKISPAD